MKPHSLLVFAALTTFATACLQVSPGTTSAKSSLSSHHVSNKVSRVDHTVKEDGHTLQFLSQNVVQERLRGHSIVAIDSSEAKALLAKTPISFQAGKVRKNKSETSPADKADSLVLGFPIAMLGQQHVFGGVITKVSDAKTESLGGLKLTDLSPLHVRTTLVREGNETVLGLIGCPEDCTEESAQIPIMTLPIQGVDQENSTLLIDLSAVGEELDLITMLDPNGRALGLKTIAASVTSFDYSLTTLVFDVKTQMVPRVAPPAGTEPKVTEFTVRWYLKLGSAFDPAFTARAPVNGVGYFTTERAKETKITRFSTTNGPAIHYFIKNVPEEFRPAFAGAFDHWNNELQPLLKRNLLSYEFVEKSDPRHDELIPGDIRYNIVEWDEDNVASYGGLGPSIANQFTGQTLSANVLIQGPTIVGLYTKWFKLSEEARALKDQGRHQEAEQLIRQFNLDSQKEINAYDQVQFKMRLGNLEMNVHSQREALEDPMVKNHFEVVPAGMTYETYMQGYFNEMLSHELGHNLGLRHNFKGNLGASDGSTTGSVSRSIMEYLGRPYRYKNAIGQYDRMAIAYGYRGVAPKHTDWFCTDENQPTSASNIKTFSAECLKSDATIDPFSFWEGRLARTLELLLDTHSASAPVWKLADMTSETGDMVTAFMAYMGNSEKIADTWSNFFGREDRPEDKAELKAWVTGRIKQKLCDPAVAMIISGKESPDAVKLAQENFDALVKLFNDTATSFKVPLSSPIKCAETN